MTKLAIDIALLPDTEASDYLISLNQNQLVGSDILLSTEGSRPHISIAMGFVEESELGSLWEQMASLNAPGVVRLVRLANKTSVGSGKKIAYLEIENDIRLRLLHESVMDIMDSIAENSTIAGVFTEEVSDSTRNYVINFGDFAFNNFWPHITLGYGEIDDEQQFPGEINVKLAICHLGNHCTCQSILFSR